MGFVMLKLSGYLKPVNQVGNEERLLKVTSDKNLPGTLRSEYCLINPDQGGAIGYGLILFSGKSAENIPMDSSSPMMTHEGWLDYLEDGDIIRVNFKDGRVRVLFRASANSNSILLTERCDHFCLMCSQPPKKHDDTALIDEAFQLLELIPASTKSLGFTGGEPTLYGDQLVELVAHAKRQLPGTALDLLTNGKAFSDESYAQKLALVDHPDLVVAVPLYSASPAVHNYVVQCAGAFDPTIRGILNLKRYRQQVQLRVVLHRETIPTLIELCEFIVENLRYVDQVALMGLETVGFARANLDTLWIDPYEYRDILSEACDMLDTYGIPTNIFNLQKCVVNQQDWKYQVPSISDWKNDFLDVCQTCDERSNCGGLFSSNVLYKHSDYISPIVN